ncbi:unnamed protein product [Clonostachys chloroleuca]|uniref:Zn(2)-C6 fungal-type domain-containing protein n=1 Tax=Clonostachys chloroleuca TaxID=1926264 RepID=A0AA35MFH1_9HYPO|nr:unnamed protein product [Clonostachys chloroleuca]
MARESDSAHDMLPSSPEPEPGRDEPHSSPHDHELGERPAKRHKGANESSQTAGACRVRKVKCDKKRPCALCRASGVVCEYLGDSSDKITLESATNSILEKLDHLQQELQTVKRATASQHQQENTFHDEEAMRGRFPRPSLQESAPHLVDAIRTRSETSFEPSRDFLRIPPQRASADTILRWGIWQKKYPPNALIGVLFSADHRDRNSTGRTPVPDLIASARGLVHLNEEQIPSLVDCFLTNVYTKNPILDVESLIKHSRRCSEHGMGWGGWSCLVLMACALGAVSKPFDRALPNGHSPTHERAPRQTSNTSVGLHSQELQLGDSCFTLACRRLGSLKYSLLGAQCHFFAGVYLMYTLRPLESWHYFYQASLFCQFDLRMTHGLSDTFAEVLGAPPPHTLDSAGRKARRLEQSLYWSCFKSECEFRVELPLPQSEISLGEYPNLFPSPPSPVPMNADASTTDDGGGILGNGGSHSHLTPEQLELRQHSQRLCNEEESWYYYLTEIALRRIGNRIINTFFHDPDQSAWLHNIRPLLRIGQEFESQISSWSAHLPRAMQTYESESVIRAPHLDYSNERSSSHVSRELSWAIDNRLLEMQTWLYQPFLYYLCHAGQSRRNNSASASTPTSNNPVTSLLNPWSPAASSTPSMDYLAAGQQHNQHNQHHHHHHLSGTNNAAAAAQALALDMDDLPILHSLIRSGIDCSLKTIDVRTRWHRHHGLWFDLRAIMSASLTLLAVVKSGNVAWIPGGDETLWGVSTPGEGMGVTAPIGGKLGKVLEQFDFWAAEAPDMPRYRQVLESVVREVRGS